MDKILVVEDDSFINQMLCELLSQNNYDCTAAFSGTEAVLNFKMSKFDLVLLDLMLPGKSGLEVLSEIRAINSTPVIALTAVGDKETIVEILKNGADDFITKPFDNDVLLARIEVQLRRNLAKLEEVNLTYKDIVLKTDEFEAELGGRPAGLSKREYEILKLLMSHPKKVFTKNNLYESVWGDEFIGDDNTINVHISNLRAKLSRLNPDGEYIQTVWGIGFRMKE